jgi:hypothetical protein
VGGSLYITSRKKQEKAGRLDISFAGSAQFFKDRAADLKRIASGARGKAELGDVESEAWLAAVDAGKKRGYPIDFADPADQQMLLGRLYNRFVKYAEKHLRCDSVDAFRVGGTRLGRVPSNSSRDLEASAQAFRHRG